MAKLPQNLRSFGGQILMAVGVPVFFLTFVIGFRPADYVDWFGMGQDRLTFNTTILMCIQLGVMLLSRGGLYPLMRHDKINALFYALWCIGEWIVMALFMALYMCLMYRGEYGYFLSVGYCLGFTAAVEMFAYAIMTLSLCVGQTEQATDETQLVRFCDNTQKLKFIIAAPALLYVEADENYVKIVYLEGETVKTYQLRTSMRAIEELMQKHGLVRCQRSYYINPQHIKTLRRDANGSLYADLSVSGTKAIPVSAMYQETLTKRL